jgi:hypothetical protein
MSEGARAAQHGGMERRSVGWGQQRGRAVLFVGAGLYAWITL